MARHVEYDDSDPEEGYEAYTYSFSQPTVTQVVEQNYGGYTELVDVTGEENNYDSKKVVVLM